MYDKPDINYGLGRGGRLHLRGQMDVAGRIIGTFMLQYEGPMET